MNERIRQLAEQAGFDIEEGGHIMLHHVYLTNRMENFAELIVKECGDIAYKAYWDNPETVRGIHIKEKIKQHFGVEE